MNVGKFIERPILSTVISLLIVILGIVGLLKLPIEQYPEITPPIVKISASYSGASATTVSQAVATPIEQELNGTPGMIYMQSNSSNSGGLSISVTFEPNTNIDLAAVEIQNRVKLAEARLPSEVLMNGITVEKQSANQLLTIALVSSNPAFDEIYLSNYATINILDVLRRLQGVGRVSNVGSRYYGMQIWVHPDRLASFGLTVKDLQTAIKDQNRESAAGEIAKQPISDVAITIPITAQGRLSTVEEFEDIVVKVSPDGSFIRVRDVADVSLEASSYNTESALNGKNATILSIYALPGANAVEVAKEVKAAMVDIQKAFPDGLSYLVPFDMTKYITESIDEVYKTLFEALVLVIIVVFLSLQNWRASIVPIVAVPISLVGTFGFMYAFGFSLNTLTLLGLVLSIGIVVDDAIVVVENVERIMEEEGLSAREATHKAMKELAGPLIATSLVLAAVFGPVSFLDGITGSLYRQFSITIVVSVLISAVVALTLSPAMCALILKPKDVTKKQNIVFTKINSWLDTGNFKYRTLLSKVIHNPKKVLIVFGATIVLIFLLNKFIPTSFFPQEDQGFFTVELEMPEGTTLDRTRAITDRAVAYLNKYPDVEFVQSVNGSSPRIGSSQGRATLTVILKPWNKREKAIDKIIEDVKNTFYTYPEARAFISRPPAIPGLGAAGGVELQLQARSGATPEDLAQATDSLVYYASKSKEIASISTSLQPDIPQLYFDVDRDKAQLLGVPIADIFTTLKAYLGSMYVNDFNMYNRIYRVYIQADASFRGKVDDINLFYVKASNGSMVPLTSLAEIKYTTGSGNINRFNMYTSASMQVTPADGYSSGQVMKRLEEIKQDYLGDNIGIAWSGLSYQEHKASGQMGIVLTLVFIFVFLFLAALYESWTVPIAVLLSLPIAAFGAYFGILITGLDNDIYFQIGLVTLIGLATKNAILIVEFAKVKVDEGVDIVEAALEATKLRFRPILMTSLAFILGMVPLVLASGPGSASRHSIGTGVFFGMIITVLAGIIFVPFFFVMVYKAKQKLNIPELQFPKFLKFRSKFK